MNRTFVLDSYKLTLFILLFIAFLCVIDIIFLIIELFVEEQLDISTAIAIQIFLFPMIGIISFKLRKSSERKTLNLKIASLLTSNKKELYFGKIKIQKKTTEENREKIILPANIEINEKNIKKIEELSGYRLIAKEKECPHLILIFEKIRAISPIEIKDEFEELKRILKEKTDNSLSKLPEIMKEANNLGIDISKSEYKEIITSHGNLYIRNDEVVLGKLAIREGITALKVYYYDYIRDSNEKIATLREEINKKDLVSFLKETGITTGTCEGNNSFLLYAPISNLKKEVETIATPKEINKFQKYPELVEIQKKIQKIREKNKYLPTEIQHELNQIGNNYIPKVVNLFEEKRITPEEFKEISKTMENYVKKIKEGNIEDIEAKAFKSFLNKKYGERK